jgi:hypothetical protein
VLLTGRRVESVGYAPGETHAQAAAVRPEALAPHSNGRDGAAKCWSCATGASGRIADDDSH